MRPDFDEIRTLTKRFALIPQKVAKFVFGVFRYADLSVLGDYKLRKAINAISEKISSRAKVKYALSWSSCFFFFFPRRLAKTRCFNFFSILSA